MTKNIYLASASPRRREILESLGVSFTVLSAQTDESCDITDPALLTQALARRKGSAAFELLKSRGEDKNSIVISADTVVACDGEILGKPDTPDEARRMLTMLSNRSHIVATGVGITLDGITHTDCSVTKVFVDAIPPAEMEKYILSGEPFDKAGGYGIQGAFSQWISSIEGCYFGVVGLPVNCLSSLFNRVVGSPLLFF